MKNTTKTLKRAIGRWGCLLAALLATHALSTLTARAQGSSAYAFNLLAGQGAILDHIDGTGNNARFLNPTAVAIDVSGNLYVADGGDHTIRKVDASGVVSTFVGTPGQAGTSDGTGLGAAFIYPYAIAIDASGNLFVTDIGAHTVRKVTPAGVVTTLAGSAGHAGSSDGQSTSAQFNAPQGVVADAAGNVYVADTNNSTIRKISSTGAVTTLAGSAGLTGSADGTGNAARFNFPTGLGIDSTGNIYVADFENSTVRKVSAAGAVSTFAGTAGSAGTTDGSTGAAQFNHPESVAVDASGAVYVMDTSNQTVRKISAGLVTTLAGSAGVGGRIDGTGTAARFFYPSGLAVNATGTVYVADTGNHNIRMVTAGGSVTTLVGSVGVAGSLDSAGTSASFKYPDGVALDTSGNLYVADHDNNTIRKVSSGGSVSTLAGVAGPAGSADGSGGAARFNGPSGVAVDATGNVYVADTGNSTIRKITTAGAVSTFAGAAGQSGGSDGQGAAARFNRPQGIAVDSSGNIWVADTGNDTIRKITALGAVTTVAGSVGATGTADGLGSSARFNAPIAIAVDTSGDARVADFGNFTIRKVTSTGIVTTVAGIAGQAGDTDGGAGSAKFNQTYGIAVDGSGNIYVSDTYNRSIRMIVGGGTVQTVTGTQTKFFYPEGIAIDSSGYLYVSDADNQSISKGTPLVAPLISSQPTNHTVAPGGSTSFTVTASVTATFQWQISTDGGNTWTNITNGAAFSGATTGTLTVSGATAGMNGNQFRAMLTSSGGSAASNPGVLYVGSARLINLSVLSNVSGILTAGFVIGGSGTSGSENLLIRGIGPALAAAPFNVPNVLPDPTIKVIQQSNSSVAASNSGWGKPAGNQSQVQAADAATGAFALTDPTSLDSAVVIPLAVSGGGYTVQVKGNTGDSGTALTEVYDDTANYTITSPRLVNLSCLNHVNAGGNLTAGFVISGSTSETVLIRASGPAIAAPPFNVGGTMPDPQIVVRPLGSNTVLGSNAGWGGNTNVTAAGNAVGAFQFTNASSKDSAVLLTLAPGAYTAVVTSVSGAAGSALVEVYEVP